MYTNQRVLRSRKPSQNPSKPNGISKSRSNSPPILKRSPTRTALLESTVLETTSPRNATWEKTPRSTRGSPSLVPLDSTTSPKSPDFRSGIVMSKRSASRGTSTERETLIGFAEIPKDFVADSGSLHAVGEDTISFLESLNSSDIERAERRSNIQKNRNSRKRKAEEVASSLSKRSRSSPDAVAEMGTIPVVKQKSIIPASIPRRSPRSASSEADKSFSAIKQSTIPTPCDPEASTFIPLSKGKRKAPSDTASPSKRRALPKDQNESFYQVETSESFLKESVKGLNFFEMRKKDRGRSVGSDISESSNGSSTESDRTDSTEEERNPVDPEDEEAGKENEEPADVIDARMNFMAMLEAAGTGVFNPSAHGLGREAQSLASTGSPYPDEPVTLEHVSEQQSHIYDCLLTMLRKMEDMRRMDSLRDQRNMRFLQKLAEIVSEVMGDSLSGA